MISAARVGASFHAAFWCERPGVQPVRDDLGSATGRLTGPVRTVPTTWPFAVVTVPLITPTATMPPSAPDSKRCSANSPLNAPRFDVVPVMGTMMLPSALAVGLVPCAAASVARHRARIATMNRLPVTRLLILWSPPGFYLQE